MRKISIQTKIVLPFVVVVVSTFSLSALVGARVVAHAVEREVRSRIAAIVQVISRAGFPLSERALKSVGELLDVGLATVAEDLGIRISNLSPALATDLQEELRKAGVVSAEEAVFVRRVGRRDFYVAYTPLWKGPDRGLFLLYDASRVRAAQWESVWPLLLAALAAVVLANLSGWYVARSIISPLRDLAAWAARVASGDLSPRALVRTSDEIGQLAGDFNRMIDSLRVSQEELVRRERLATLGMVAAGVAHEIRNPLTSMKMIVEMLRARGQARQDDEGLEVLENELERLRLTLGALLDYAGQAQSQPGQADLHAALKHVLELLKRQLAHHQVQVVEEMPVRPLVVRIDPSRLRQVLLNIVLNGIEAMPRGGTLRAAASEKGGFVELAVSDTGAGIAQADLAKIFEPFFSRRPSGCGLGLAISRRFVEDSGGAISAANTPAGAAFTISLPKADRAS